MGNDILFKLWGKTVKDSANSDDFHPAIYHMLDAGNVARELLDKNAPPRWRNVFAHTLNTDPEKLLYFVPYFVALHDIGKISSTFQSLNNEQSTRLRQRGIFVTRSDVRHTVISQIFIADLFATSTGMASDVLSEAVYEAIGGHHGRFIDPEEVKKARRYLKNETTDWQQLRNKAEALVREELLHYDLALLRLPNLSTAIMAITGFAILCDWLGSDARSFPPSPKITFDEYLTESRNRAKQAASDSGMLSGTVSNTPVDAKTFLADLGSLRPLQLAVDDIPDYLLESPSLTIIEAPTGEGKTEAALTLAHRIAKVHGTDEMYYALPTMATSNQMFGRLRTHLEKHLRLGATIKLVHGQAFLVEEELRIETPLSQIQPLDDSYSGNPSEASEAITWFNTKKRALLAPFGVGTIDQAELAALNVKHVALRMMGLAGKVVIVDEVHAYDTYMTTIIERLLRWLSAMNTSVIILSATLPIARRRQLAQAFGISLDMNNTDADIYPSFLLLTTRGTHHVSPGVWQPKRTIDLHELHWGDDDVQAKVDWLMNAVENGGCACWITNTVERAQRTFGKLFKTVSSRIDLGLLHSQFPLDERNAREQELNAKYGRNGKRPQRGIVIGTQILEQSLDLDFDVMVTDLAPVDLLLQRAGRLHRHDRQRPPTHSSPRLHINFEITPDGKLKPGSDRNIYAEYLMRQTQRVLGGHSQIQLPRDYRVLVEAVYSNQGQSEDNPFHDAWEVLQHRQNIAMSEAKLRLLPGPQPRDSFAKTAAVQIAFEEDENRADWVVAQTRLGEESLNIIPIERKSDLAFIPGLNVGININEEALLDTQRKLLKRSLRISNRQIISAMHSEAVSNITQLFKKSSLLQGYYPLWLYNGKTTVEFENIAFNVVLDPQLGLVIEKEERLHGNAEE